MAGEEDLSFLRGKIQEMLPDSNLKEISDVIWKETKKHLKSKNCYLAFVDPENKDIVGISFSHLTPECQMYADLGEARFKVRKDGSYGGLLGYSLDTGESLYIHDVASHPVAHGVPQGHEPVDQFLSVPVKFNNEILGQIVVGNPEEDYDAHDLEMAENIAEIYGMVLKQLLY